MVAARLLKERQVSPGLLTENAEFRDGVLARFRDASLGRVSDSVPTDLARKTLELISALQPFNTDAKQLRETAAKFLGVPGSDFVRTVDELERAGILLRRGLRNAATQVTEPIVLLKLRDAVQWSAARGQTASIRTGAREVRDAVPDDFEIRLTGALTSPWSWNMHRAGAFDADQAEAERVGRLRVVADEVVAAWPQPAELAENIGRRIDAIALAGERLEPGPLGDDLCRQ